MTFHGYEIVREWKNSQCGKTAIGKKGGKSYFIKKYQTPVMPLDNGSLTPAIFEHNKRLFEKYVDTRRGINSTIRKISGSGGNIVVPSDEFIDGNQYVEASELVDGAVPDEDVEEVVKSLPIGVKQLLMQTAAGALSSIHAKRIVHSDLKLKNVLLALNERGNYVAKLIDFDSSFFIDDKPEEIVGTIDYYSPELGEYADNEDDREELAERITEKTDIFSLGLIFHQYLTGQMPEPTSLTDWLQERKNKGKLIYCWVALNNGCELQISSEIKNPKFASLIRDMLSINPEDRPSASEVLKRLSSSDPVIEEPWPEHKIVLDKDKMKSSNVSGLKKIAVSGDKKYELLFCDGRKVVLGKDELVSKGYVKVSVPEGFCDPWPEHGIRFDEDKLKSRGFVSAGHKTIGGVNGYELFKADSSSNFFRVEMLLMMKYAVKTGAEPASSSGSSSSSSCSTRSPSSESSFSADETGFASPWPEHGIEFDQDVIKSRGYVASKQDVLSGVKGYKFFKPDGTSQFVRAEMAVILKIAKKI